MEHPELLSAVSFFFLICADKNYGTLISSTNLIKGILISLIPQLCLLYIMLVGGLHIAEVHFWHSQLIAIAL